MKNDENIIQYIFDNIISGNKQLGLFGQAGDMSLAKARGTAALAAAGRVYAAAFLTHIKALGTQRVKISSVFVFAENGAKLFGALLA